MAVRAEHRQREERSHHKFTHIASLPDSTISKVLVVSKVLVAPKVLIAAKVLAVPEGCLDPFRLYFA